MQKVKIESFKVIGIAIRTTNENGQAAQDIPQLWSKFMSEGISEKIPNKIKNDIFCIYTNYESDHTKPYDTVLACQVSSLDNVPVGMVGHTFKGGLYEKFVTKGDLNQGIVYNAWLDIWEKGLDRNYTTDFEIYGEKAQNPADAEVDIFIALNK